MYEIIETRQDDVLVLTISGELMGGEEAVKFQDLIYRSIEKEEVNIVANLKDINWMNSSGLGMLMGALTTLRSSGGDLRLAEVPDRVKRPITVTKLDRVLSMFATVDLAVQSFVEGG
ncbi:STAS domain-containing protein [bacterium]|nr:STAS domain-containing protein [bacterium]